MGETGFSSVTCAFRGTFPNDLIDLFLPPSFSSAQKEPHTLFFAESLIKEPHVTIIVKKEPEEYIFGLSGNYMNANGHLLLSVALNASRFLFNSDNLCLYDAY